MSTRSTHTGERPGTQSRRRRVAALLSVSALALAACSAESEAAEPTDSTMAAPSTTSTTQAATTTSNAATAKTQVESREFEHLSTEQPERSVVIDSEGQVPFYARIEPEPTRVIEDGGWAMVYLYRPAECIPPDFDLLTFFHFPGEEDPGAFACQPATTDGVGYWENGPETDPAPILSVLDGTGSVPVWFVAADEYLAAMEDGLTIGELESLTVRKGTASEFHEVLDPDPGYALSVRASGKLDDGAGFLAEHRFAHDRIHYSERGVVTIERGEPRITNIEFSD